MTSSEPNAPAPASLPVREGQNRTRTAGNAPSRQRTWRSFAFLAVIAIAAVAIGWWWITPSSTITTDDAYTAGQPISIAPQVSGTVSQLSVTDNEHVTKGQLLLVINPAPFLAAVAKAKADLEITEAQLHEAETQLTIARTNYPAKEQEAQASVAQAQAQLFQAETNEQRLRRAGSRVTSQQTIDDAIAIARGARAALAAATARLTMAKQVKQNIALAASHVAQLKSNVAATEATLKQKEIDLGYTTIRAPESGWVTRRSVAVGDYISPGQLLFSVVTDHPWVTANFKETALHRLKLGQKVRIRVDAYPNLRLTGRVNSIQMGSGSVFSAFPAENATGNYVKIVQRVPVKITITSGLPPDQALPLGLSVEPTVRLK